MKIKVLGAHNCDSRDRKLTTLLVDNVMALEASALTSSLSFEEQQKLQAVFITHHHYDHLRDIPALGMNLFLSRRSVTIYSSQDVYETLSKHLVNGDLYPLFFNHRPENPVLIFQEVKPMQEMHINGYVVKAIPVNHSVPTFGFYVVSSSGASLFYTGDTGKGLTEVWSEVNPRLLIIEVTASNRFEDSVGANKHLTPRLLHEELIGFQRVKGYLPHVLAVHINPFLEKEIYQEIQEVSQALGTCVQLAQEGMEISISE